MDRNERFRGKLMAGNRLVLETVEGHLKTHQRNSGPLGEWTGYFELPEEMTEPIVEGNRYRIVLIDGRSGTVNVRLARTDVEEKPRAQFHGTGSFRK
jgi:hypothetical protein